MSVLTFHASRKRALGAAVGLVLAGTVSAAYAQDKPAFSDQQKAAIGALVREYLINNPEVIQEALTELDARQKSAEKAATRKALSDLQSWVSRGQLKVYEDIVDGFENLPAALIGLLAGDNIGKRMVKVA